MPGPTPNQQRAIAAGGNVLVEAAAGAGKTRTVVERCLDRVLRAPDPVSFENLLMVTFTEAAAAEMRRRIREALEARHAAAPDHAWLAEQLALLDSACIGTLHSFCLRLVREHFHVLGLDPQVSVLDDAQARLLAAETLDAILQRHYAGSAPADQAVQRLILEHGGGRDESLRALALRLHDYAQTLPDADGWLRGQLASFQSPQPAPWEAWLLEGLADWRREWLETLATLPSENLNAGQCLATLKAWPRPFTREQAAAGLEQVLAANGPWPKGKKVKFQEPLKPLFAEAAFLHSLARCPADGPDPLVEDWSWVRPHMKALLELTLEFSQAFAEAKRAVGGVDFHDLEQFALRLLWDAPARQPTALARHWRARLRLVFVDEYQDINAAQDAILEALSGEGAAANRFLVGDVKQSIYRFRLANPRIFQQKARDWREGGPGGQVIPLADNFRSHEAILEFANAVFGALLRPEVGGVGYPDEARLRVGRPELRPERTLANDAAPRVELHLRLTGGEDEAGDAAAGVDLGDLTKAEQEARLVGLRLRALKQQGLRIWKEGTWQPVQWRDMVVLLRSAPNWAEAFAKEFARLQIPLEVERGGFYDSTEVTDLLSLLQLLDNPLQDLPALAVLRSPFVGLTLDELAALRLAHRPGRLWLAALRLHRERPEAAATKASTQPGGCARESAADLPPTGHRPGAFSEPAVRAAAASAWPKLDRFFRSFARWRQLARQGALSHCLETVLDETHYEDWLLAQPRGPQRRANVRQLLSLTRQFDQFQRQGLFRFLNFVAAQQEAGLDAEPASVATGDTVRLMTIHRSKGLEFPVVVVAGLGKGFNLQDLKGAVVLDEDYGLCPLVKPAQSDQRYPSLPWWLAARRQRRETLGEELRLLYVAFTRPCDRLLLAGTASRRRAEARWGETAPAQLTTQHLARANCALDWLGPLLPTLCGRPDWMDQPSGQHQLLTWTLHKEEDLVAAPDAPASPTPVTPPDPEALADLAARLRWRYAWPEATVEPAKTSVTALRRRLAEDLEAEARPLFRAWTSGGKAHHAGPAAAAPGLSAAERGTAQHKFLQHAALAQLTDEAQVRREVERLTAAGVLSRVEAGVVDAAALAEFWCSDLGRALREQPAAHVHRELPFTARFSAQDFASLGLPLNVALGEEEFIVVQGVADLAVVRPAEIWLVDFKTDELTAREVEAKARHYAPQLRLYGLALERIYDRAVRRRWLHFLAARRTVAV